ncbi:MAG: hypothetical protein AMJ53_18315, partial [Gammaproteobacteria bacterium SG8_11]
MGLFQKNIKGVESKDNLPEYVDELLDAADLSNVEETEITGNPLDYGIDQAIELLQKLPQENASLVVSVVRQTLQSANIDVDLVVQDAQHKAERMQEKIAQLNSEIAILKTQIAQKETEIVQTDTALKETLRVQALL